MANKRHKPEEIVQKGHSTSSKSFAGQSYSRAPEIKALWPEP